MIAEDAVFLLVVLVPLFAARWRVSLLGLSLQGVLLFRAASVHPDALPGGDVALNAVDYLVVRAVLGPAALYAIQHRGGLPHRNDVIPANLFAWVLVVLLTTGAFRFAAHADPTGALGGRVAVASAALVLGLFVLASQDSVFSQIVGMLRIENAVALFETALPEHPGSAEPGVRLLQVAVIAGVVATMAWYLRALHQPVRAAAEGAE
ncbi:MAG: hypothetical protein ABMB14_15015 [Myxococcota bacterium]